MSNKDSWKIQKFLLGFPIVILFTNFSYRDEPLHHICQRGTDVHDSYKYNESYSCSCGRGYEDTDLRISNSNSCSSKKHIKTYQCEARGWRPILNNCVLHTIKDLERKAEVLVVEDLSEFVSQLSNVTDLNNIEITRSAVTVKTVVKILLKIADISQNITVNKLIMEDFIKTVNTIVSDKYKKVWEELNNDNLTENTSSELLLAVETISGHLSEDNFTINESSIQLKTTTIENSFYIRKSLLLNSTTQIMIPEVPKPTHITIIFFSNFDNVLPAQNTNDNGSGKSDVLINGDVVVIKVNQTINNISFTFDVTDESLGNAQCVFWNFDLNGWDSTGCKVKPSGNETGKVTCECNHTTSFSILMSPFFVDDKVLDYITYIGIGISVISLILCLIIEMIVWKSVKRDYTLHMRHVSVVNISVSLLIADICFIIGAAIVQPGQVAPVGPCSKLAFVMHFFYLANFFWMLSLALLLLYYTVMVFPQMSQEAMMAIAFTVGYGAPLLIAVITVASTAGSGRYILEADACWLDWEETKSLHVFVILTVTIVAINLAILVVILYKMLKNRAHARTRQDRRLRRGINATTLRDKKHDLVVIAQSVVILAPIFGLTWGFGIGTMVSPDYGIHVVFATFNSLQGFFILVFGTLLDSEIRNSLRERLSLKNSTSHTKRTRTLGFFQRMQMRNIYRVTEAEAPQQIQPESDPEAQIPLLTLN